MLVFHQRLWTFQVCKPKDFAMQINLSMENAWGIVRALVDLCLKLDEGKYLLLKDPNKPIIRLYEIAADAFETNYTEEPIPQDDMDSSPLDVGTVKKDEDEDDE
jgi:translation initiation factor 3 subunit D